MTACQTSVVDVSERKFVNMLNNRQKIQELQGLRKIHDCESEELSEKFF